MKKKKRGPTAPAPRRSIYAPLRAGASSFLRLLRAQVGDHPPVLSSRASVGKKTVTVVCRAPGADAYRSDPGRPCAHSQGRSQVQPLVGTGRSTQDLPGNFRANFITAAANAYAAMHCHFAWVRSG